MNPLRVLAENYRTYERLDVELPTGCTAVVGPNGAGKSSIVNVVELALFGPANRQIAPYLMEGCDGELVIGLEFEHRGEMYRVRRRYSPSGAGKTTLDFERSGQSHPFGDEQWSQRREWQPLTRSSMKETQALIEETIGLTRDTLRASAFLAQGDGAAFTEALPARRKEILGEVLGLGVWDELAVRARARRTTVENDLVKTRERRERAQDVAGEAHALEVLVKADRDTLGKTVVDKIAAESELEAARARYAEAREAVARTDGAKATLRAAEQTLGNLREQLRISAEAAGAVHSHQEPLRAALEAAEHLQELEAELEAEKARVDGHRLKVAERAQALRQVELIERSLDGDRRHRDGVVARIEELESGEVSFCQECGRPLEDEHKARVLAARREELGERQVELTEGELRDARAAVPEDPGDPPSTGKIDELAGLLGSARTAARDVVILTERVRHLEEQAKVRPTDSEVAQAEMDVEAAGAEVQRLDELTKDLDLEGLQHAGATLATETKRLTEMKSTLERAIAGNEARLQAAVEAEQQVKECDADLERFGERKAVLELAVRAYSRDGVPAMIVESLAVPQIEAEANRILADLGTAYMVELRTQRETKAGTVSEALDIVVHTALGERPYETFSGGERTRLNLSLRIALARLLAHRRGAEVRLLAIDEPEFLDDDGVEQLATVLHGLVSDFERIILISHMPALRESFTQALVVSKDGERSTVTAGGAA